MTDLLLTHGYFLSEDEHERKVMKPYPPLGLLYIAGYLKRAGMTVEVFDSTFAPRADLESRLATGPAGALGIYTNLTTRKSVLDIVRRAKASGWTVVLGGPESANYSAEYLQHGADVVVFGEGEETLKELLPALAARGPHRLHGVLGTAFTDDGGAVVTNLGRPQIKDLDALPWPDREAIDTARYVDVWREHHGKGSVNLITARGCPYRCNWCSHAVFGFTHRRRSVISCADELAHIVERYRPDQVWYADDVFTIHHRWLFDYAAELERRHLRIPFETISRADRMLKDDVVKTLADMGCWRIWIGAESGSQRILDAMQRGVTVEQVLHATRSAQQHGIHVGMFLMWGYDGETEADIDATIDLVRRAAPDVALTTVAYPIKGTGFFDRLGDRVGATKDWADATDRDYEVRGQRSRDFYREADRRLRQAIGR
ncbi:MAG: B12-binding domain-containing radical SAM protein [Gemmatimonadetes bacterium]|nr:B12-binding domain-containing radical SAM protein [Gemmatimonadota bacterium]